MFQCISEQDEMVVVIYEIVDNIKGHDHDTEEEDTDAGRRLEAKHTEGEAAWSRCYRLTAVCVVLLCVVLLTAVTVLWIKYNTLNTEYRQIQTSYNNLTIERDQLQRERDVYFRTFCDVYKTICFNSSLYFMSNEKKSWTESRQDCKNKGADLVIINSNEEQDFIVNQLKATQAWIGLSDRDKEGEWKWVDGTLMTSSFSYWASYQPDNYQNDEDCGEICNYAGQRWNDRPCSIEQAWICEKRIQQNVPK